MGLSEYITIITAAVAIGVGAIVAAYPRLGTVFIVIGVLFGLGAVYQHSSWVRATLKGWPIVSVCIVSLIGAMLFGGGYWWFIVAPKSIEQQSAPTANRQYSGASTLPDPFIGPRILALIHELTLVSGKRFRDECAGFVLADEMLGTEKRVGLFAVVHGKLTVVESLRELNQAA